MSKLTFLQKAMRIVEQHEPSLFAVHTQKGRNFIHDMHELLKEEGYEMKTQQDDSNINL
jgi:hypothetical protein